jgi:hypothetical protein
MFGEPLDLTKFVQLVAAHPQRVECRYPPSSGPRRQLWLQRLLDRLNALLDNASR